MTTSLPPDPYAALGVSKTATLAEIRSSHRKLVLKCHPDKVQDPAQKAIKQDEFQKVQQAYELLSDDNKRRDYDDMVRLEQLRKGVEQLRSGATSSSRTHETEFRRDANVRTAEPRESTFRARARDPEPMYRQAPSRSEEDYLGRDRGFAYAAEQMQERARRPKSYEEPSRGSRLARDLLAQGARDADRRRDRQDDESRDTKEAKLRTANKLREAIRKTKERAKEQKVRDTEKRKSKEEKTSRTTRAFVESASEESDRERAKHDKKATKRVAEELRRREEEEETRARERLRRKKPEADSEAGRKYRGVENNAAQYIMASKASKSRKAADFDDEFRPSTVREKGRAHTFQEKPLPSKYSDEEDDVQRSRAQRTPRRASEQMPEPLSRTRERESRDASTRSREGRASHEKPRSPVIVDAPFARPPAMPLHNSSPANLESMANRREAQRSTTMPASYRESPRPQPTMARGSTFTEGLREHPKVSRSSRLKTPLFYAEPESDSDDVHHSSSPRDTSPTRRRPPMPTTTSYRVSKEGVIPSNKYVPQHSGLRDDDEFGRRRSRSREVHRSSPERETRPQFVRTTSGTNRQSSSSRPTYYDDPTKPIIKDVHPRMSPRDHEYSNRGYFENIQYSERGPVQFSDAFGKRDADSGWDTHYVYAREPHRARESARA